ncbi:MAG: bifunctional glutamate N-acetyltransferase/amino-acid acetyltransferase ArgJ [Chitinivibrionales bacterium]|nr:bifunctional glutamate N-acetyltransferase/amino-acid acetyltransferase ArgJ [Chitinivibrionales bacterium]
MSSTPQIKSVQGGVTASKGFTANGLYAGIKQSGDCDAAFIGSEVPCTAAGAFTQNNIRASCVNWCEKILPSNDITAIFCNSGNANACTGVQGEKDTKALAQAVARCLKTKMKSVLVASTGVIGNSLPMESILHSIPGLVQGASTGNGRLFSQAIMTTDTRFKEYAVRVVTSQGTFHIGGSAKGSGMIHPNMATMLSFITTDSALGTRELNGVMKRVVDWTFNNLTVDGDCSTNDMALILANGTSGVKISSKSDLKLFERALFQVCNNLCAKIAEDGEGATKRIEVNVVGGKTYKDSKLAAKAVANSNLVKTAIFGNDPNWGRILCAIGYSGARFSKEKLRVCLGKMPVCKGTSPVSFPEKKMRAALNKKVVTIDIDLGQGNTCAVAHTCDLTYDYIKINAEYHT